MKVAVIQTTTLPYEKAKVNYFLSILRSKGVKLVVIAEYVLNLFFKDLENTPINFIKQQSKHQLELFKRLANRYNMTIIAPLITIDKENIYKSFYKFSAKSTKVYHQQILMPYEHWNEKKFFSVKENKPLIFKIENIKIALLPGFETHFDEFWKYFRDRNVELVVVPSIGTFTSQKRWQNMLTTFAFLNNCYVLRANRVGKWNNWKFYGESFLSGPDGNIIDKLGDNEELLIVDIDKNLIKLNKKEWEFSKLRKNIKGLE
jgi:nitrilase